MKLKFKIMAIFFATIFVSTCAISVFTIMKSTNSINDTQQTNLQKEVELAAKDINKQLTAYVASAVIAGYNPVISNPQVPVENKQATINIYLQALGFVSGNVLDANGISLIDGTDFSDRDYVQLALAGQPNVSSITLSKYTNTYGTSLAAPIRLATGEITGVIYFRIDIDFMQKILEDLKISENCIAYIVNSSNEIIAYEDNDYILKDASEIHIDNALFAEAVIDEDIGIKVVMAAPETDFNGPIKEMTKFTISIEIVMVLIGLIVAALFTNSINKPIVKMKNALVDISNGKFDCDLKKSRKKDEIAILQNTAFSLIETLQNIIGETNKVLNAISNYDLSSSDMEEYPGEYNQISISVNHIKEILTYLIVEIQSSASEVKIGSKQLAEATQLLSTGATTQSASIDKLLMEMNDIADSINKSSENGQIINRQLHNLENEIDEGNAQMNELSRVVKEIEEMSSDIQKIVGTIDSISFQTNILALNASVEAARAGENGRGFAVVAEEVSALAAKSSEASKRTGELIDKCIAGIQDAQKCANQTAESLNNIVSDSKKIASAFLEITEGTDAEAEKANIIKTEVNNISSVVQSNSSSAMETAASTEELSSQAISLEQMVGKFIVG